MARSIIELPSDLDGDYEVYLNGVQQAYVDFDVDERVIVFNQPLRKDRISGWRRVKSVCQGQRAGILRVQEWRIDQERHGASSGSCSVCAPCTSLPSSPKASLVASAMIVS